MGELHLEIYIERMKREYACEVIAGKPQVAYRETLSQKGEYNYTHKKQTGGSGQYGKVAGYIEPLPSDHPTGFEFVDEIVGGTIPREFIPACEKGFKEAIKKGPLIGFPIVGRPLRAERRRVPPGRLVGNRLQDGGADGLPRGLHEGQADHPRADHAGRGPVPRGVPGRGHGPAQPAPRAPSSSSEKQESFVVAQAEVPLNDMFGYSTDLRSATQGKGEFSMEFKKYAEVPKQQREAMIAEFKAKKDKDK